MLHSEARPLSKDPHLSKIVDSFGRGKNRSSSSEKKHAQLRALCSSRRKNHACCSRRTCFLRTVRSGCEALFRSTDQGQECHSVGCCDSAAESPRGDACPHSHPISCVETVHNAARRSSMSALLRISEHVLSMGFEGLAVSLVLTQEQDRQILLE